MTTKKRKRYKSQLPLSCETCKESTWKVDTGEYECRIWQKPFCEKFNHYYYRADRNKRRFEKTVYLAGRMEKTEFLDEKEFQV